MRYNFYINTITIILNAVLHPPIELIVVVTKEGSVYPNEYMIINTIPK